MTDARWEKRARELFPKVAIPNYGGPDAESGIGIDEDIRLALQLGKEMAAEARTQECRELAGIAARFRELETERQRAHGEAVKRAADARAEEIANECERAAAVHRRGAAAFGGTESPEWLRALERGAAIARATIEKKPAPEPRVEVIGFSPDIQLKVTQLDEAAIRADERKKIAIEIEDHLDADTTMAFQDGMLAAAQIARVQPPKTREDVLEEALREVLQCADHFFGGQTGPYDYEKVEEMRGAEMTKIREAARRALDWTPDR